MKTNEPYIVIECEENDVRLLCSRSILIRSAYELWAYSTNSNDFISNLKSSPYIHDSKYSTSSFKIQVEAFNKKLSSGAKVAKIEQVDFLPFNGPIVMKDPDHTFARFEFYGVKDKNKDKDKETSEEPEKLFFGRLIAEGQRDLISKHSLKSRKFISNTSMDPAISLMMANIGKVDQSDIVIDPFVGSGSLLVAAAHFGAHVVGTEIDFKLLYGLSRPSRAGCKERDQDESVESNLDQYGLRSKYVDVLLSDASMPVFRPGFEWDAIICDPPYGIRESSERVGRKKNEARIPDHLVPDRCPDHLVPDHLVPDHYPAKVHYNLGEIIQDLMDFGAKSLKMNGRLLFWMPVMRNEGEIDSFDEPRHESFQTVVIVEQVLAGNYSRLLLCMEKIAEMAGDGRGRDGERRGRDGERKIGIESNLQSARSFRDHFFESVKNRIEMKKNRKK